MNYRQNIIDNLEKKQKEVAKKQLKIMHEKEKLTNLISKIGLWLNKGEVEDRLKSISKKTDKTNALKLQLERYTLFNSLRKTCLSFLTIVEITIILLCH